MHFFPDEINSNHFSYKLSNLRFERVWEFQGFQGAIWIKPGERITSHTNKPIKFPTDPDGNQVDVKFIIDGLHSDDVLLYTFLVL